MNFNYDKVKRQKKTQVSKESLHIKQVPTTSPPTESQLELIATLKQKLEGVGKDISYLAEPDSRFLAKHVINSLIKLCKKYNL